MPIEFACSTCSKQVQVPDGSEGKKCKCPECQTILNVPKAETEAIEIKLEVPCPRCDFVLVCDPSLEGTRGLCPNCKLIFTIEPQGSGENAVKEPSLQMTFAFQCPHCKQLFEGKPGMEGRNGKCIHCHQVFEIKRYVDPVSISAPKKAKAITASIPKAAKPVVLKPTQASNLQKPFSPVPSQTISTSRSLTNSKKGNGPFVWILVSVLLGSFVILGGLAVLIAMIVFRIPRNNNDAHHSLSPKILSESQVSGTSISSNGPKSMPTKPFSIVEPIPQPKKHAEIDLSEFDPNELYATARQAAAAQQYVLATKLQYWSLKNSVDQRGAYDLSCYYCQLKNVDAAIYWLQVACESEGVNAAWAHKDHDLENLRNDARWKSISPYLQQMSEYWKNSGWQDSKNIIPTNYDGTREIGVLVFLHGRGASPIEMDEYQDTANRLDVAMISVSGTIPHGRASFSWDEANWNATHQRIQSGIDGLGDRIRVRRDRVALMGFSQGAMCAVDLCARKPQSYSGVICMSPGGDMILDFDSVQANASHALQGYVMLCAADEAPGNIWLTRKYVNNAIQLKARVYSKEYAGVSDHTFPSDTREKLPVWLDFIFDTSQKAPTNREVPSRPITLNSNAF